MLNSDVDEVKQKEMAEHTAELEIEINASRTDDEIRREHERDRRNLWLSVYQSNLDGNRGNVLGKTLADKALEDFDDAFSEKEGYDIVIHTQNLHVVGSVTVDVVTGVEFVKKEPEPLNLFGIVFKNGYRIPIADEPQGLSQMQRDLSNRLVPERGLHTDPSMYTRHAELLKQFERGFR